jgi:hypothetical protein
MAGPTEGNCPLDLLGRPKIWISRRKGPSARSPGLYASFNFSGLPAAVVTAQSHVRRVPSDDVRRSTSVMSVCKKHSGANEKARKKLKLDRDGNHRTAAYSLLAPNRAAPDDDASERKLVQFGPVAPSREQIKNFAATLNRERVDRRLILLAIECARVLPAA